MNGTSLKIKESRKMNELLKNDDRILKKGLRKMRESLMELKEF